MSRAQRPRRRKPKTIVPIAAMGDIAFLLIIFFIVVSRTAKDPNIPIEKATSADIETLEESPEVVVTVTKEGELYLNREPIDNVELLEAGVAALIEGATTEAQRNVIFKCDKNVDRAVFMPAMQALVNANARPVPTGDPIE